MANDLGNISSASVPYMVSNDKSGLQAAQSLDTPSDLALNRVKDVHSSTTEQGANQDVLTNRDGSRDLNADIEKQARDLQELSQLKGWAVSFQVDNDLNKTVIKVFDADTQKMIRQIPSEELLSLNKRIQALRDSDDSSLGLSGLLLVLDSQV